MFKINNDNSVVCSLTRTKVYQPTADLTFINHNTGSNDNLVCLELA